MSKDRGRGGGEKGLLSTWGIKIFQLIISVSQFLVFMWGAHNYNSVLKLSPEERWVQVQINFRLPQQRQSILNEDASKMLLKGPQVSYTHTETHKLKQFGGEIKQQQKSLYSNYTQDLRKCPCLPGTAFDSLFPIILLPPCQRSLPRFTTSTQCLFSFGCLSH